jgi:hypothetical protein
MRPIKSVRTTKPPAVAEVGRVERVLEGEAGAMGILGRR